MVHRASSHLRVKEAHVFYLDVQELDGAGAGSPEERLNPRQDACADEPSTLVIDGPIIGEVQGQVEVEVCKGQNCKESDMCLCPRHLAGATLTALYTMEKPLVAMFFPSVKI